MNISPVAYLLWAAEIVRKLTICSGVEWDNRTKTKSIYKIVEPGRKGWSKNVDQELGNYDFLVSPMCISRNSGLKFYLLLFS